ncbi:hypothetical protein JXA80_01530 [bacterium]|nr:hypothetical protein [candidate division CSSED10-310 bacterium]
MVGRGLTSEAEHDVVVHCSECPACRQFLEELQNLVSRLEEIGPDSVLGTNSPGYRDIIRERVRLVNAVIHSDNPSTSTRPTEPLPSLYVALQSQIQRARNLPPWVHASAASTASAPPMPTPSTLRSPTGYPGMPTRLMHIPIIDINTTTITLADLRCRPTDDAFVFHSASTDLSGLSGILVLLTKMDVCILIGVDPEIADDELEAQARNRLIDPGKGPELIEKMVKFSVVIQCIHPERAAGDLIFEIEPVVLNALSQRAGRDFIMFLFIGKEKAQNSADINTEVG